VISPVCLFVCWFGICAASVSVNYSKVKVNVQGHVSLARLVQETSDLER